jgi:hypothetical protein
MVYSTTLVQGDTRMKFKLKVTFAGQTKTFDLDYDDEVCVDEEYGPGEDSNNQMIIDDFYSCVQLEVTR